MPSTRNSAVAACPIFSARVKRVPWLSPGLLRWLGLAAVVMVADQSSKALLVSAFSQGQSVTMTSFFDLVYVLNRGAAFSFLSTASGWQRWFFVLVALGISAWIVVMIKRHSHEHLLPLALALVLGGALGNVIDRLVYGAVVDFLSFHLGGFYWPAFNVADSAISIGVVLMLWQQFIQGKSK